MMLDALEILRNKRDLTDDEDEISRQLVFSIREANCRLLSSGRGVPHPITFQGQNPPQPANPRGSPSERKKPDFYWAMIDPVRLLSDPEGSELQFVIECKRLGKVRHRKLNEQYVTDGMRRFMTLEHSYGIGVDSGLMVGYVQNTVFGDILDEVNGAANALSIPSLVLSPTGWKEAGTSRLDHTQKLSRPFPIATFQLIHFWLDLRMHSAI